MNNLKVSHNISGYLKKDKIGVTLLLILSLLYVIFKAYNKGVDIDYYLQASQRLFLKEDIYDGYYLYGPFFALLLSPLTLLPFHFARIIWAVFNLYIIILLYKRLSSIIHLDKLLEKRQGIIWSLGLLIISFGYLNHNIILGQTSMLILWLTMEGLYQIMINRKDFKGALLIALGINFKIIPLLAVFYLIMKARYKVAVLSLLLVITSMFLPMLFLGYQYDVDIHRKWIHKISPTQDKYIVEVNPGTISLNAILPVYFSNAGQSGEENLPDTTIVEISDKQLVVILQVLRILIVISFVITFFYKRNMREKHHPWFYWELSYLALVTILIFPHQQKYAMLYFVPAAAYFLAYFILLIKERFKASWISIAASSLAVVLMFICGLLGRDIVGDRIADFMAYLHFYGLVNIIFLFLLFIIDPIELTRLSKLSVVS